jgi:hypothetical protein
MAICNLAEDASRKRSAARLIRGVGQLLEALRPRVHRISPSNQARARRRTCCATPSPRGLRRADRTHIGRIKSSTHAASDPESATALRADSNAAAQGIHADLGILRYEWVAKGEDLMDKGRGQGMAADTGRGSSGQRISNGGRCARSSSGLRREAALGLGSILRRLMRRWCRPGKATK